ncbi:hypothetical protein XHV734_3863 [Xanthomonas hortorum pv. vitians]|nr:hypothetical protein XHV734_3863 [Xanthomonas hortorum pv. vitians]
MSADTANSRTAAWRKPRDAYNRRLTFTQQVPPDGADDEGAGQARSEQGHLAGTGSRPQPWPQRGADQAGKDRNLRHRSAHLRVGRVEPAHHHTRPDHRP